MFKADEAGDDMQIETMIGEKTKIKGDLKFTGGLHIDGEVDGSVEASNSDGATVHLSESSLVKGQLKAPIVIVNGRIEGDIHANERVELHEKARVSGNIHYKSIEMRLGAEVNGQLVFEGGANVASMAVPKPAAAKASAQGADTH